MALDFRNSFARLEIPRAYMIPDPFKRPARASVARAWTLVLPTLVRRGVRAASPRRQSAHAPH